MRKPAAPVNAISSCPNRLPNRDEAYSKIKAQSTTLCSISERLPRIICGNEFEATGLGEARPWKECWLRKRFAMRYALPNHRVVNQVNAQRPGSVAMGICVQVWIHLRANSPAEHSRSA